MSLPIDLGITYDQTVSIGLLVAALALFVWGRWRYDLVAFAVLIAGVILGAVPGGEAFRGFGHPAVITVAAVLVVSRGLAVSGAVEFVTAHLIREESGRTVQIVSLCAVATVLSAFINNVGALALLLPVALQTAARAERSPAMILMPLSFASILGGLTTLIGTPPNIIVSSIRAERLGEPFSMFDFSPVGVAVALVGVAFVALIGWRLIPAERMKRKAREERYDIEDYVAEAQVPKKSKLAGRTLAEISDDAEAEEVNVVGLIRGRKELRLRRRLEIREGDVILFEAAPDALHKVISDFKLEVITPGGSVTEDLRSDEISLVEAVVQARAQIEGRTVGELRLAARYGVNLLAVSRQGRPYRGRLRNFQVRAGDVLLLQGDVDQIPSVLNTLGCLPLAERGVQLGRARQGTLSLFVFAAAILAMTTGALSAPVALAAAALAMPLLGIVTLRETYDSIDWPILVLLGALIPVGEALESSGAADLLAGGLGELAGSMPSLALAALLMIITMSLSNIINNAATAVVMAPIGISLADALGVSPDPFLMAVAVGASCAFLTPIGHQNNTLVMGPGGYRFGDYWRMGLPLQILIVAVSVPMIAFVWPL